MHPVNSNQTIKARVSPKLWLLPYDVSQIDLSAIRHDLAAEQQQRFDTLGNNRKAEFGVTRLFLQYCLHLSLTEHVDFQCETIEQKTNKRQAINIQITEQRSLPPKVNLAEQMGLDFNISHSKHLIAIIIAKAKPESGSVSELELELELKNNQWGLDVEQCRPVRNQESATLFCNPTQLATLHEATSSEYIEHYYRFWTQKEAVLKAKRSGIVDATLKNIEGIPCSENNHLRSSQFINPTDESAYMISAFCNTNTEAIKCQLVDLDKAQQFSLSQAISLTWQNYSLDVSC